MSGGETDLRSSRVSAFVPCGEPGCDWRVESSADVAPRCRAHGGRDGIPAYFSDADGAFLDVRHMTTSTGVDCE